MNVRDKLNLISKARDRVEIYSTDAFIKRHGVHPGGPVAEARERFYESLVEEFESMRQEMDAMRKQIKWLENHANEETA